MKIVLAEDGPIDALILKRILLRGGYAVITAPDGTQALEAIRSEGDVALVVADVDMPEMDGIELFEAVKNDPALADIPFIFVSAHNDADTVHRAVDLKPAAYLLKPITQPSRVLELVERVMEERLRAGVEDPA